MQQDSNKKKGKGYRVRPAFARERLNGRTRRVCSILGLAAVVLASAVVVHSLYVIQIRDGAKYRQYAAQQQLLDTTVKATRGEIYDANGITLASTSVVWNIWADPSYSSILYTTSTNDDKTTVRTFDPTMCAEVSQGITLRLLSGDGLCLCVREKEIPLPRPVTLAVFPRLVPVSTRWFLRNSWELETGARGFQDDRTVIRNVRAYQPGDNARSLNFRLMARGQGAMVNIYEKISPRRAAFLLDGASFAGLPPEDFESALEILGSLAAQLMEEEVAVSLLISRPAGRLEQFATCRDRRQLPAVLTLLAAADTAVSITADEILPRLRTLSGAFLICGDVRRLDAGTCALLERHRVPLLAWGEQSHPLLRVLDLNAFRAGGGL